MAMQVWPDAPQPPTGAGSATNATLPPAKPPRFGRVPLDVYLAQNQVANRFAIEALGLDPWVIALARNNDERIERAFDRGSWIVIGLALPLLMQLVFNRVYAKRMWKQFNLPEGISPLKVNFERITKSNFDAKKLVDQIEESTFRNTNPGKFSAKLKQDLINRGDELRRKILFGKMAIIFTDLFMMASKGQIALWGKNYITEKRTGKKGFVGEYDYASDEYLKEKSKKHEETKSFKQKLSLGIGYGSVALFMGLMLGTLQTRKAVGKGMFGKLKKLLPHFNYYNAIFMSKWLIFWHTFFNYMIPGLLAARDGHERREHLSRILALDFFYYIGDDVFAGLSAVALSKKYRDILKKDNVDILRHKKIGPFNIPLAVPYHKLHDKLAGNPNVSDEVKAVAQKAARRNFWTGILTTAAGLGISVTLINNWFTKKKVLREQEAMETQKATQNQLAINPQDPSSIPNQLKPLYTHTTQQFSPSASPSPFNLSNQTPAKPAWTKPPVVQADVASYPPQ